MSRIVFVILVRLLEADFRRQHSDPPPDGVSLGTDAGQVVGHDDGQVRWPEVKAALAHCARVNEPAACELTDKLLVQLSACSQLIPPHYASCHELGNVVCVGALG